MSLTTNNFAYFYNKVATICQDQSTNGIAQAKDGVNTIIKELTKMFKLPETFKGQDQSIFVTLASINGVQSTVLPLTDLVRISDIYWVDNNQGRNRLLEIPGDQDWDDTVDNNSNGDPSVYRYFQPSSSGNIILQTWPGVNQSWINKTAGKLIITYWAQLAQLVADADIPNLPYELDTVLTNGGVVEMARQQGDTVLMELYQQKYTDDLGEIRAWIIKQRTKDGQMQPDETEGTFGRGVGITGYRVEG